MPECISYSTTMDWMSNSVRGLPRRVRRSGFGMAARLEGFSLIELLIVAALVLVLTSLYWESSAGSRQRQLRTNCQQDLQKIYMALQIYANDSASRFPVVPGARTSEEALSVLIPRYTVDTAVFICPASKDPPLPAGDPFAKQKISYAYYMGRRSADAQEPLLSDRQVNTDSKAAGNPVFSSTGKAPGNNHGKEGGNFLFGDGRAQWSPVNVGFPIPLTSGGVILLNPKP
jgi:prepilin-type N-terminal cleavage/methylation domain-containing protein